MDFTLNRYRTLLNALQGAGYSIHKVRELAGGDIAEGRTIYLRHDVDLRPERALEVARVEAGMGIHSTFYFRAVPQSRDEGIIREISAMGHEVGYHYESLTTCRGDSDAAYRDFCINLERLRAVAPVETVCMHGSPRSPFDSRDIWKKYSYRPLGVLFEPYMDTDWSRIFYLTDTGRRWDGYRVSVRDRIPGQQKVWTEKGWVYHTTRDIVDAARKGLLPKAIMITTHPQRWTDSPSGWFRELCLQGGKNMVKRVLAGRVG